MRPTFDQTVQQFEALMAQGATVREHLARLDALIPRPVQAVRVPLGSNVQLAMGSLHATGGILELEPGAHDYAPILPLRPDARLITVRGLGQPGDATLRGFMALPGSANCAFEGVGFVQPATTSHVKLGDDRHGMTRVEDVPRGFSFYRCPFVGPARRGIAANCRDLVVEECTFTDYYQVGFDSQAICGWNGSANHRIIDNLLEAASENIAYGGADAASELLIPQDITIEGNRLTKRPEWATAVVNMKCAFELKNALRVNFRRNEIDGVWRAVPTVWSNAPGIKINTANQDGTNPWARVEDVEIADNVVRNVGQYVNIVGRNAGPYTSGIARRIRIVRNRLELMHADTGPEDQYGWAFVLTDGPEGVVIDHNSVFGNWYAILETTGLASTTPIVVTNNIIEHGRTGLRLQNASPTVITHNAVKVPPAGIVRDQLPPMNVYYQDIAADLSEHVTSDGLPVGA